MAAASGGDLQQPGFRNAYQRSSRWRGRRRKRHVRDPVLHEVVAEPSPGGGPPSDKDGGGALRRQQRASTAGVPGLAAKPAVQRSQGEGSSHAKEGVLFAWGLTDESRFCLFAGENRTSVGLLDIGVETGCYDHESPKSFGSSLYLRGLGCVSVFRFFTRAPLLCPMCVLARACA